MKLFKKLICSLGLFFLSFYAAANPVFHYEPEIVRLSGTIIKKTYPGSPNYESIKSGDTREDDVFLKPDQPFDVTLTADDDPSAMAEQEKNIKIIQLSIDRTQDWKMVRQAGKHVIVIGSLFHRFTGHHHTRILILTKKIEDYAVPGQGG